MQGRWRHSVDDAAPLAPAARRHALDATTGTDAPAAAPTAVGAARPAFPHDASPEIVVCVATFRRRMLLVQTLRSLYGQRLDRPFAILVCDNDAETPLGADILDGKPDDCAVPTAYVVETDIGISQARNAMCAEAMALWPEARWIAMIDDDEIADHGWLAALVEVGEACAADVVSGHQIYDVPAKAPGWLRVVAFDYGLPWQRTGPARIASTTGNVLLRAELLRRMGQPLFNLAYARTGGSDYEFFVRAKKGGAAFAHAAEALTFEYVDERRRCFAWWWRRSVRHGATYARTHCTHRSQPTAIMTEVATAALRIGRACAIVVASRRPGRFQRAGLLIGWVVGQVRAIGGQYGDEYGDAAAAMTPIKAGADGASDGTNGRTRTGKAAARASKS